MELLSKLKTAIHCKASYHKADHRKAVHHKTVHHKIAIAFVIIACLYIGIVWLSHDLITPSSLLLIAVCIAAIQYYLWLRWPQSVNLSVIILVSAFAVRLIAAQATPMFEDDYFRYLWDGYIFFSTGSPYGVAPAEFFGSTLPAAKLSEINHQAMETLLDQINYPYVATVYGPFSQAIFALAFWLAPAQTWPLQLFIISFDIGIIALLLRMTSARNVMLYAWSPFILMHFTMNLHIDVFALFFMLLAVYLMFYQSGKIYWVAIALALGFASKVFIAIIIPLLLRRHWRSWLLLVGCLALIYWPFMEEDFFNQSGLLSMAQHWLFNAPIYQWLLAEPFNLPFDWIKIGFLISFCCFYAYVYFHTDNKTETPDFALLFAVFILCLPAVNAWYWSWVLIFAVIKPRLWMWVVSLALLFSYFTALNLGNDSDDPHRHDLHQLANWVLAIEYGLIVAFFVIEISLKTSYNKR